MIPIVDDSYIYYRINNYMKNRFSRKIEVGLIELVKVIGKNNIVVRTKDRQSIYELDRYGNKIDINDKGIN